jgi:hypothetical protein
MNKEPMKDHDHDKDQEQAQPQGTKQPYEERPAPSEAETYFFPNDGGVTSFSCRADSREEAEQRNQEHLEHLEKENR